MVADVFPAVVSIFSQSIGLFERVFSQLGAWGLFLTGFFIFTLYRLLLRPLIGASVSIGASDTVKKIRVQNKTSYTKGD